MSNEEQCRNIYRQAFKDPDTAFEDKLFKNCFEYCKLLKNSDEVAAMLFVLPCKIIIEDTELNAGYIYAAATLEKYRRQGYMRRLIESLKNDTGTVLFLKPANAGLNEFYRKMGFTEFTASFNDTGKSKVIPGKAFLNIADGETDRAGEKTYTAMYYYKKQLKLDGLWFSDTMS